MNWDFFIGAAYGICSTIFIAMIYEAEKEKKIKDLAERYTKHLRGEP